MEQTTTQEPFLQTTKAKLVQAFNMIKTKITTYREQKEREKLQRINLDVNKQQWGEGVPQEQGKTTNIAPPKAAPPPKPPKIEGLH